LLAGPIPLLDSWADVSLIAQPRRFHVLMEMPIAMAIAIAVIGLMRHAPYRPILISILVAGGVFQTVRMVRQAYTWMPDGDPRGRPEFEMSQWFAQHTAP